MTSISSKRGAFIVFEGLDRSGKSTQSKKLTEELTRSNHQVEYLCFPNRGGPIGKLIDQYLRKEVSFTPHTCHFLFSGNRWESQTEMERILKAGSHIVADRYAFSGVAYSHGAEGLDVDWVMTADRGLIAPDVVFYIDVTPEVAAKRSAYGEERYEKLDVQRGVRETFMKCFQNQPFWKVLDGNRPVEELFEEVRRESSAVIERAAGSPLTRLWDGEPSK